MAQNIQRYDAVFAGTNTAFTITLPTGVQEVALRVYEAENKLSFFMLAENPLPQPVTTYVRTFMLIPAAQDVPANYLKYIGNLFLNSQELYLIEVTGV
jgi:hypothetical protein